MLVGVLPRGFEDAKREVHLLQDGTGPFRDEQYAIMPGADGRADGQGHGERPLALGTFEVNRLEVQRRRALWLERTRHPTCFLNGLPYTQWRWLPRLQMPLANPGCVPVCASEVTLPGPAGRTR